MRTLGIDIGSRTIKTVVLCDKCIERWETADAVSRPLDTVCRMIEGFENIPLSATGYGRHLLEIKDIPSVTEIKACTRGIRHLYNDARVVIDIGGQDLKVISLDRNGKIAKFEMNDRCAAGTGKFLEIMAEKLNTKISDFGGLALRGSTSLTISSLCTVFAESEVIGLLNRNESPEDIANAVHRSAVKKVSGMYKRSAPRSHDGPVYLTGGGALNAALCTLLEKELDTHIIVPEDPQITVALGAAVIAAGM